jgi:hypothetical protein
LLYAPSKKHLIISLRDYLTLVLGGRQAGVFAGRLFLEDSGSFDGAGSV